MGIWLVMQSADGIERPFRIEKPCTIIGRETKCDVRIPMSSVSSRHCEIRLDQERLHLTDLNSTQGTYHNGDRVAEADLSHEDTLRIGPVTFTVRINPGGAETEITRCDA